MIKILLLYIKRGGAFGIDFSILSLVLYELFGSEHLFIRTLNLYFLMAFIEYILHGKSLGKYIFRIKIISINGTKPNFFQLLLRVFIVTSFTLLISLPFMIVGSFEIDTRISFYFIAPLLFTLLISFRVSALFGMGQVGFHDYIAKTMVINEFEEKESPKLNFRWLSYFSIVPFILSLLFFNLINYASDQYIESNTFLTEAKQQPSLDLKKLSSSIPNASVYLDLDKPFVLREFLVSDFIHLKLSPLDISNATRKSVIDTKSLKKFVIPVSFRGISSYNFKEAVAQYIIKNNKNKNWQFIMFFTLEYETSLIRLKYENSYYVSTRNDNTVIFDYTSSNRQRGVVAFGYKSFSSFHFPY